MTTKHANKPTSKSTARSTGTGQFVLGSKSGRQGTHVRISDYALYLTFKESVVRSNPLDMINIIRAGVTGRILVGAARELDILTREQMVQIMGMSASTFDRRVKHDTKLSQDETERLARLAKIEHEAENVFGSRKKATRWLKAKNLALGSDPLSLLDTAIGAQEVRKVLNSIAYGGAV